MNRLGAILVFTAFALVALIGITALVIDFVMLDQTKLRAQATVDSAVLAAAQDLDDIPAAVVVAQAYALRNHGVTAGDWVGCTDPGKLPVPTSVNCISVDAAEGPTFIRIRLPGRVSPTFFGRLFGVDAFTVNATATAEVVLSGGGEIPGGPSEEEIIALKKDIIEAYGLAFGVDTSVPFTAGKHGAPNYVPGVSLTLDILLDQLRDIHNLGGDALRATDDCDLGSPPAGTPSGAAGRSWGEYVLVFEHLPIPPATAGGTTTVCGTSADETFFPGGSVQWGMDTWIAGIGGDSPPGPGMPMHVSCSQNFVEQDGWDDENKVKFGGRPNGPVDGLDTDWHIISYLGARYESKTKAAKIELKLKGGEFEFKVEPPRSGDQPWVKETCNFAFTPVTSPPVVTINLSN